MHGRNKNGVNKMLTECKLALRVTADAYDAEIMSLLEAGAKDLEIAGVVLPGTVSHRIDEIAPEDPEDDPILILTDTSTLTDPLCQRALITYARAHFGSPADYDKLVESYETQKEQLMHASDYTDYEDGENE